MPDWIMLTTQTPANLADDDRVAVTMDASTLAKITGFDVNLRYRQVDVFVAKEYRKGSCPYRAILAHEREHVRVSRKNLEEYAPRVHRALTSLLIPTGQDSALVVSAKQARKEVKAISDELLQPVYKDMMKSLVIAQKSMDSPRSYARLFRRCSDW